MRRIVSLVLLVGATNTALAHTVDGSTLAMLGHEILGLHHLPLSIAVIGLAIYLGRNWHRSDGSK
jgi:predicted transporter